MIYTCLFKNDAHLYVLDLGCPLPSMTTQNQADISTLQSNILESLGNNLPDTIVYQFVRLPDDTHKFTYISENVSYLIGKSAREVLENPNLLFDTILERHVQPWLEAQKVSFENMSMFNFELECKSIHGDIRWLRIISNPQKLDDGTVLWTGIQTDITKEKNNALKLQKNNRELKLLNAVNDIINAATNPSLLLTQICECLVENGHYKLAWMCKLPELNDPIKTVTPIASYGITSYLDNLIIDLTTEELRRGPTASVLLDGGNFITNNFETSNRFKPWLDNARKVGFSASGVFSIKFPENINGAFNVYSDEVNAFDEHETNILNRIANNLSLALNNISIKSDKDNALFLLKERNKELKTVYNISKLLSDDEQGEEKIIQEITNLLPSAWLYPNVCEALVVVNGNRYTTKGYVDARQKQQVHIINGQQLIGYIEIVYTKDMPEMYDGPFLKEEKELMTTVAEMISTYLSKKNTFKALTKSEANLKSVFDNTETGYVLIDSELKILSFNKTISTLLRMVIDEELKIGASFLKHVLPEKKQNFEFAIKKVFESKTNYSYETAYSSNQQKYYYIIHVVPVIDDNKVISICISAYDVTNRKNMELEQQKITRDLLQRNRDLEQFAFIVSHNLRSPVANILGLNMLLKESLPEEEKQGILEKINISAQRLDEVVQDLNTILQIRREVSERKTTVHLNTLVINIKESIENIIHESHTIIEVDFSAVPQIEAIRTYIGSVLFNMITNSIKYARPNVAPHIFIQTKREGKNVVITYNDNGRGIDMQKYGAQVFGLYKRFHAQTEGKGIGLFMTKTQVEVMGGKISLKSKPNEGCVFTITLPDE